jgi:hypothetical protein
VLGTVWMDLVQVTVQTCLALGTDLIGLVLGTVLLGLVSRTVLMGLVLVYDEWDV